MSEEKVGLADERLLMQKCYLRSFIPALVSISATKSFRDRLDAIRHAADLSMCTSLGKNTLWSRALSQEMRRRRRRRIARIGSSCLSRIHDGASAIRTPRSLRKTYTKSLHHHLRKPVKLPRVAAFPPDEQEAAGGSEAGDEDQCQLSALRDVIPGGAGMDVPVFLKEAAHYIVSLQAQVGVLRALTQRL